MFVAVLDNALRVSPEGGQVDIIYDQKKMCIRDSMEEAFAQPGDEAGTPRADKTASEPI